MAMHPGHSMRLSQDAPRYARLLRRIGRLQFLRKGLRARLLHRFADPHADLPGTFETSWHDFAYRGRFASYLDWHVFFFGDYEAHIATLIEAGLERRGPAAILYDVGANVGLHAMPASRHAAEVHAFEPFPPVLDVLRRRVAENAVGNIVVHPVALGEATQWLPYHAHPDKSMTGSGSFLFAQETPGLDLPVVRGDDYVAENHLPLPDVIKIDTEGYDLRVLAGLRHTIARARPMIVMEVLESSGDDLARSGGLQHLLPDNYHVHALSGPRPILSVFLEPPRTFHLRPLDGGRLDGIENLVLVPAEMDLPRDGH